MSEPEGPDDVLSLEEVTIPFQKFLDYLSATNRSTKCPLCPHDGNWHFSTSKTEAGEDVMQVYSVISELDSYTKRGLALMTCPGCGYSIFTDLTSVHDFLIKATS